MLKRQEKPFQKTLTPEEIQFIRDKWYEYTLDQLAFKLQRHPETIRFVRRKEKFRTETSRWTVQETEFLKQNIKLHIFELCSILKRHKKSAIRAKVRELKRKVDNGNEDTK